MFAERAIGRILAAVLVLMMVSSARAIVDCPDCPDSRREVEYAPGELLVKFSRGVSDAIRGHLAAGGTVDTLRLTPSFDSLTAKYQVSNIFPVLEDFYAEQQRLANLLAQDVRLLTASERHLVRRLKRAPKGVEVPDLGTIHKVVLDPDQSTPDAAAEFNLDPAVEYAELNYIVHIASTEPNDPCYPVQWPLANTGQEYPASGNYREPPGTYNCDIDANEAWDITTGSSDIVVAVIDTGVDYTHRDLQNNMWTDGNGKYGYDFVNDDSDPMDDNGHGTHGAGIIAADSDNGVDIAGVSWNAKIMAIKFLNSCGSGSVSDAVLAFAYATDNGADIISNSWGGTTSDQTLQDAIDYAYSQGVIVVAAAGNSGNESKFYPANYEHVISVAATDANDDRAPFSNYGDWVDIAAPGVDILSLRADDTFLGTTQGEYLTVLSGTSMACPHVSGTCALLLSVNAYMSPDDANDILRASADELDDPDICNSGRLNAHKALLAAVPSKGYVSLDRDYYNSDCNIIISLADSNLVGQETEDVNIATSGGDSNVVTLYETGSNTGVFAGAISSGSGTPNIGDGILQVSHDETITVTYEDLSDGVVSDTATADCVVPSIISQVTVVVLGPDVTVTFETDEYTLGRVLYDVNCGGD